MGKIGFILLVVGGILLIISGQSLTLDFATQQMLINLINTYITPHISITGETIVSFYILITSLGGVGVIVGAIIWYVIGYGCGASIGKLIVSLSLGTATVTLAWFIYGAYTAGVFSQPLHTIIAYFAGLGIAFASVFIVILGTIFGAGRPRPPKEVKVPATETG